MKIIKIFICFFIISNIKTAEKLNHYQTLGLALATTTAQNYFLDGKNKNILNPFSNNMLTINQNSFSSKILNTMGYAIDTLFSPISFLTQKVFLGKNDSALTLGLKILEQTILPQLWGFDKALYITKQVTKTTFGITLNTLNQLAGINYQDPNNNSKYNKIAYSTALGVGALTSYYRRAYENNKFKKYKHIKDDFQKLQNEINEIDLTPEIIQTELKNIILENEQEKINLMNQLIEKHNSTESNRQIDLIHLRDYNFDQIKNTINNYIAIEKKQKNSSENQQTNQQINDQNKHNKDIFIMSKVINIFKRPNNYVDNKIINKKIQLNFNDINLLKKDLSDFYIEFCILDNRFSSNEYHDFFNKKKTQMKIIIDLFIDLEKEKKDNKTIIEIIRFITNKNSILRETGNLFLSFGAGSFATATAFGVGKYFYNKLLNEKLI
jgi:hypothetical protein